MAKKNQTKSYYLKKPKKGFTIIELIVVIGIIVMLSAVVIVNVVKVKRSADISVAGDQQRAITKAVELYFIDMGFYPPDVNRGWDPGFAKPLPWNPDTGTSDPPTGGYTSPGTNCSHCPPNWQDIINARWSGPYLSTWPKSTPWGGKYDYNYWGNGASRFGCSLMPGVYAGVQGNYSNQNTIPQFAEEEMIDKGFESETCLNGESQMLLKQL